MSHCSAWKLVGKCRGNLQLDQIGCQPNLSWDGSGQVVSANNPARPIRTHAAPLLLQQLRSQVQLRSLEHPGSLRRHPRWHRARQASCKKAQRHSRAAHSASTHRRCSCGWKRPAGMVPVTPGRSNMCKSVSTVKSERKSGNCPSRLGNPLMFLYWKAHQGRPTQEGRAQVIRAARAVSKAP